MSGFGETFYGAAGRWTSADHVHQVLQRLIINGDLGPGNRLTELGLAAQLKVSRTPLRHALQRLVSERWLRRQANGAIHVVEVSAEEIEALYAVRAALEEMMIAQAAEHMARESFAELREILVLQDRAAKANDPNVVSSQGERFHRTLWRLSGNAVGIAFLEEVLQRTTRYRRLSFSEPYRFKQGSTQHWQILKSLEGGDIAGAQRVLRRHVEQSRNFVLQAFRLWRDAVGKHGRER